MSRLTASIWECSCQAVQSSTRVDREAGIIRGVKVLGFDSQNGRRYTRKAVEEALRLYEGISVRTDHPDRPHQQRKSEEVVGRLVNIRLKEDGLFADLELLNAHPLTARLYEAGERMPHLFGLSHNAEGEVEVSEGIEIVHKIKRVHSVDIVADPATTKGLYESIQETDRVKATAKAFFEALEKRVKGDQAKKIRKLIEMGMVDDEEIMEIGDEEEMTADPDEALKDGFRAAIAAAVDQALEGDTESLKKVNDLIKTHQKMMPSEAPIEEEEDEEEYEDEDEEEIEESIQKRLRRLERKELAYELLEQAGVSPDKTLLEALVHLPDKKLMQQMIEREKGRSSTPYRKPVTQRSDSSKRLAESVNPDNYDDFIARIKGSRN